MPERRHHHVLNGALFPISQPYLRSFCAPTIAWVMPTLRARSPRTLARNFSAQRTWSWLALLALTRMVAAFRADFRLKRLTIPLRIIEMMMRPYKVVNRKVILAVI